jgi:hypothetical protein
MKLSTLAYCYSKLEASTCERKLQQVKSKLYMLFDKYSSKNTSYGVQGTIQDQSSPLQKKLKSSSHGLFDVRFYIFFEITLIYQSALLMLLEACYRFEQYRGAD